MQSRGIIVEYDEQAILYSRERPGGILDVKPENAFVENKIEAIVGTDDLKLYLSFWDKIAIAASGINLGYEENYLRREGILSAIDPSGWLDGVAAKYPRYLRDQIAVFRKLEADEPGTWSIARRPNAELSRDSGPEEYRSLIVRIYNALPVPEMDVPFNELIWFRNRNISSLFSLRTHIEGIYEAILQAPDEKLAMRNRIDQLSHALAAHLNAFERSGVRIRMAGLEARLHWQFGWEKSALGGLVAANAGVVSLTGIVLGGVFSNLIPNIELKTGANSELSRPGSSPFEYVIRLNNEFDAPGRRRA